MLNIELLSNPQESIGVYKTIFFISLKSKKERNEWTN
jgi:hypothetical protein